jgi:glyoxylase-like metal-dependent hydrolase (beta-lactamase superfamily II)
MPFLDRQPSQPAPLNLQTVVSPLFEENAYIFALPGSNEALVVDPGFDSDSIEQCLIDRGWRLAAILNTHGHADHIAGNEAMKRAYPRAPLIIGTGDAPMLTDPVLNLSGLAGAPIVSPPADLLVNEGEALDLAGMRLEVLEIPGHSPGHIVFVFRPETGDPIVFGGDVLFRGSIGRTDFPGGSHQTLMSGIRKKLFSLPEGTLVYPGHGPVTTVGHEKKTNPYCGG